MASGFLDDSEIELACTCGKKHRKTLGWIRSHREFTCSCGTVIELKADKAMREIDKVNKSVADLENTFRNFGKR